MSRLLLVRLACIAGLLGSALAIGGFFLPLRAVSVAFPPAPATNGTDSYWSMLSQTATGGTMNIEIGTIVLVFVLSILIPAVFFLGGLFNQGKPMLFASFLVSLIFTIFGFLGFLLSSALFLLLTFPSRGIETHTTGPGFWLMLVGFPLCIGASILGAIFSTAFLSRQISTQPQ